ncbi:MAG TPA: hypothetical protein DCE42_12540 [Myxococcales bacterium]|nr:hypothetical protein [Deltaproteobacteria bacterium]MBU50700.1 hypothetical protein [Deltaproteobacteria bacterium]HAA55581.1 hypothetical protein [Myxococcales bacterium]
MLAWSPLILISRAEASPTPHTRTDKDNNTTHNIARIDNNMIPPDKTVSPRHSIFSHRGLSHFGLLVTTALQKPFPPPKKRQNNNDFGRLKKHNTLSTPPRHAKFR